MTSKIDTSTPCTEAGQRKAPSGANIMKKILQPTLLAFSMAWSLSAGAQDDDFGVLVMAHGGSPEWNQGVLDTVAPLTARHNLEVAFGMADAVSMQEAVTRLEERGADRIAVVRLFVSGESWYERTEQILGMRDGAPARGEAAGHPEHMAADAHAGHGAAASQDAHAGHGGGVPDGSAGATRAAADTDSHAGHMAAAEPAASAGMGHSMEFWRIDTDAEFALSKPGLADAEEMADVLLARATALSSNPAREDVLILAHGPGDDAENERWLASMDERAELIRDTHAFRRVKVATLREDWEEKRVAAEQEVREFVTNANATGGTAIVIPYRVHGFGPYQRVLEGLEYVADGQGLIPHPGVTRWIEAQIAILEEEL